MSPTLKEVQRQLVTANHILHYHGAVDGFGHISARHPDKPDVYIMCGYMPPASVESADDLIEYYVDGSATVDPNAPRGYSERYIHGELFKRFPDVMSVVHSHAEAVIPYVCGGDTKLKPMYHMAGFMKGDLHVWDIAPLYSDKDQQDMLVNSERLGASLAAAFSTSEHPSSEQPKPDRNVVLMKRHGYTTFGKDIPTAVYRTVYTLINASVQTNATLLQAAAHEGGVVESASITGLEGRHAADCQKMTEATQDKSWRLWCREVEASPLYRNKV